MLFIYASIFLFCLTQYDVSATLKSAILIGSLEKLEIKYLIVYLDVVKSKGVAWKKMHENYIINLSMKMKCL